MFLFCSFCSFSGLLLIPTHKTKRDITWLSWCFKKGQTTTLTTSKVTLPSRCAGTANWKGPSPTLSRNSKFCFRILHLKFQIMQLIAKKTYYYYAVLLKSIIITDLHSTFNIQDLKRNNLVYMVKTLSNCNKNQVSKEVQLQCLC